MVSEHVAEPFDRAGERVASTLRSGAHRVGFAQRGRRERFARDPLVVVSRSGVASGAATGAATGLSRGDAGRRQREDSTRSERGSGFHGDADATTLERAGTGA
jgi:hypothetical protein